MRRNKIITYACLLILIAGVFFSYRSCHHKPVDPVIKKVDSIEQRIDTLYIIKDSIQERIKYKEGEIQIKYIEYEKKRDVINNQSVSDDYEFFAKYLNDTKLGLDSCYNSSTAQKD